MNQILNFFNKLNNIQKASIIGGVTFLFIFLIGLIIYSNIKSKEAELSYIVASHLTKKQVTLASAELEAAGIPFVIVGSGNNLILKTNKENVNIAKIKLLTSESIQAKHTGWEIFDKSSLGTTNFENNIKFIRATEGELSRALESLDGIISANVKIALPKQSVFTQRKTEPTASAILVLRDGVSLSRKQIEGIKNFIASAIPKLKPQNIKLINQFGAILEKSQIDLDNEKFVLHNEYKKNLEKNYEKKIVELLEPVVGINRVIAKVTVDLDFTKEDVEQEIYDPEGTIRSQQINEKTINRSEKDNPKGGVPGVQSNIQNPLLKDNSNTKSEEKVEETKNITNYEISKQVIHKKDNAFAKIKKIAVAVTFDASILKDVENKQEYIDNIKSLVENSVGIDTKRGDKVSVKAFKFKVAESNATNNIESDTSIKSIATKVFIKEYSDIIQYIISAIIIFIFYKKFIATNDINISETITSTETQKETQKEKVGVADEDFEYEELNQNIIKNRLKKKIKNQILAGIEGIDEETMIKYEVLVEELDNVVNHHPDEVAKVIEVLLSDGESNLKNKK